LANIESGRTPIRYDEACITLGLRSELEFRFVNPYNPLWLFNGSLPMKVQWPLLLPASASIGLRYRTPFSEFASENLEMLALLASELPGAALIPESWLEPYFSHWVVWREGLQREQLGLESVESVFRAGAGRLAARSEKAARLMRQYDALAKVRRVQSVSELNKSVDYITENRNIPLVKSEMQNLLGRLETAFSTRGKKAELARTLHVRASRLSEWMSGAWEPGGETTLRMLRWVQQQEANQQESPDNVSASPGPKTQSQESYEKKPKSGQSKS